MNSIISDINNEIKEHLKLNIEKSVLKSLEEKLSKSDPLDCLKSISEFANKHFSDSDLIKDIDNIYEIVKLNLTFNQAGK